MCHVSRVKCQVSHVTFHMLCVTFFFILLSGMVSWARVCYQCGLPCLVYGLFLIKNALIPDLLISAYSGRILINKNQIYEDKIFEELE